MKKVIALLILLVAFSSCESDVKFNSPGFQGIKDNVVWRGDLTTATFTAYDPAVDPNEGYVTMISYRGLETVTLQFPLNRDEQIVKLDPATYRFGYDPNHPASDSDIYVSYAYEEEGFGLEYLTGMDQNIEMDDRGNAEIVINQYDGMLSGSFKFNAKYQGDSELVPTNVNFQEGFFYKIPLE
jgi:hypothetical protein